MTPEALSALIDAERHTLQGYALRYLRNRKSGSELVMDAEDVVGSAVLASLTNPLLRTLEDEGQVFAYLCATVRNLAISVRRGDRRHADIVARRRPLIALRAHLANETAAIILNRYDWVMERIAPGLTAGERTLLELRYQENLDFAAIAGKMGIVSPDPADPGASARMRHSRLLDKIRRIMGELPPLDFDGPGGGGAGAARRREWLCRAADTVAAAAGDPISQDSAPERGGGRPGTEPGRNAPSPQDRERESLVRILRAYGRMCELRRVRMFAKGGVRRSPSREAGE